MNPQRPPATPRPPRRRPRTLAELPFPRLPAVRWFNPRTLLTTARLVLLSAMFAEYADKREIQAAISSALAKAIWRTARRSIRAQVLLPGAHGSRRSNTR